MGKDKKAKIIPTLKDSSTTASSDQEKANMFVNNLENIFFKDEVEQFTILNGHLYQPISTNNLVVGDNFNIQCFVSKNLYQRN